MYDPLAVAALVISIASALFVAIKEGVGLIFEYRESDVTTRRKKEIDKQLHEEMNKKLKKFRETEMSEGENSEEEILKDTVELGRCAFLTRYMTERILNNMTKHIKGAFKNLAFALIGLFFTLLLWTTTSGSFSDITGALIPLLFYISVAVGGFYFTIKSLRKYHFLREKFVLLSENPTHDYCRELQEDMQQRNLW